MLENLQKYHVVLASNSPRRKELLGNLGLRFDVRTVSGIDESYPPELSGEKVALHIVGKKADAYRATMAPDELVITADTIVCVDERVLGKPADADDARAMLRMLSGRQHHVVTAVGITTADRTRTFAVTTEVTFAQLSDEVIDHYIEVYRPYDKAGAYGIQEWIGHVGVTSINGSFFNVMGLPVQRLFQELQKID